MNIQEKPENTSPKEAVLIIEDNYVNAMFTSMALKLNYEPVIARNCEEALALIESRKFKIIYLDINLGKGPDGIETAGLIRAKAGYENVPIIAISAFSLTYEMEQKINEVFKYKLPKPYTRAELLEKTKEILEKN